MTPRNHLPAVPRPAPAPPTLTPRGPAQPDVLPPAGRPPLSTPLVWAGGGVLLTGTMWLGSMIALFRAFGSLFY